jgi:hypothetical protein
LIQRDFLENIGFDEMQKNLWRDRQAMMLDGNQHQQVRALCRAQDYADEYRQPRQLHVDY